MCQDRGLNGMRLKSGQYSEDSGENEISKPARRKFFGTPKSGFIEPFYGDMRIKLHCATLKYGSTEPFLGTTTVGEIRLLKAVLVE